MGAWGTAIFSDDLAADIKEEWRDLIGEGYSSENATEILKKEYKSELNDADENSVFWLALAASQWHTGRLLEPVKLNAIKIIDSGENLKSWSNDEAVTKSDLKKREKVLIALKEKLLSEQPKAKKISKPYREYSTFEKGDIFSYRHNNGKLALLRVIGIHHDKGGRFSVCEILDWFDTNLPDKNGELDKNTISKLPITYIKSDEYGETTKFMLGETVKKYAVKPEKIGLVSKGNKTKQASILYSIVLWREFEEYLIDRFENNR